MRITADKLSMDYDAFFGKGKFQAGLDYQQEGVFHNPYVRHTPEWAGYHYTESKQFRQELENEQ